jgi:hypothetical protein
MSQLRDALTQRRLSDDMKGIVQLDIFKKCTVDVFLEDGEHFRFNGVEFEQTPQACLEVKRISTCLRRVNTEWVRSIPTSVPMLQEYFEHNVYTYSTIHGHAGETCLVWYVWNINGDLPEKRYAVVLYPWGYDFKAPGNPYIAGWDTYWEPDVLVVPVP